MTVSPEEFWQALTGEAGEDVRKRVLQAIEEGDPGVRKMIEQRQKRAMVWLKLLEDKRPGVVDLRTDVDTEDRSEGKGDG
jgi:hypothetical protein